MALNNIVSKKIYRVYIDDAKKVEINLTEENLFYTKIIEGIRII